MDLGVDDGEVAEVGVVEMAVVVDVDLGNGDGIEGVGGCVGGVEETGDVGCAGGRGVGAREDVVGEGVARGRRGSLSSETVGGLHCRIVGEAS